MNTNEELRSITKNIQPLNRGIEGEIQAHLDFLTKPPGSLGRLEELAAKYALIRGTAAPVLKKKKIFTFAADHGVARSGVSAYPQEVTKLMVDNMLKGGAAVNVLCSAAGADLEVVDAGVIGDGPSPGALEACGRLGIKYRQEKIAQGTDDITDGPAMSPEQTLRAIKLGFNCAIEAKNEQYDIIGTGEMGIANTTPSSALMAALLPASPEATTGRGTGVDDKGLERKVQVVKAALEKNSALLNDPVSALSAVGGLEIAAITGLILGAASSGLPVVVDGFISSAAALAAARIEPLSLDYMFFSHQSAESGYGEFIKQMNIKPLFDFQMRLGEGTGAALAFQVIEASVKIYNEMATFADLGLA